MKKLFPLLLVLGAGVIPLRAVDLIFGTVGAGPTETQTGFATSDGTDLATGSLVRIGTFSLTPSQISANAGNYALLNSAWTEITTSSIGAGEPAATGVNDPANAGLFTGSIGINTTATGLNNAGQTVYYWVFNATTTTAATQHGIFGSTTWALPAGDGNQNITDFSSLSTDLNYLTVDGSVAGGLAGTALVPVGAFGPGTNTSGLGGDFRLTQITAIPEPANVALAAALGALGLGWFRRRLRGRK